MPRKIKPLLFFLWMVGLLFSTTTWAANCPGQPQLRIEGGTPLEVQETCRSFQKITALFAGMGIKADDKLTLFFKDVVYLPGENESTENRTPVYGYFDTDTREIHLMHFQSPAQESRSAWGLAWTNELASSFLLHEMTHLVVTSFLGADFKRLARPWHEALAYAVQLELMPVALQKEVLSAQKDLVADPFTEVRSINFMSYAVDPDSFAIRAFAAIQKWGGRDFIKKVLDNQIPGTEEE